jgi:hypothetical protein
MGVGLGPVVREAHLRTEGLNPSGGRTSTFHSYFLLTAKGSSARAPIVVACLLCTLLSAPTAAQKGRVGAIQIPFFFFLIFLLS